MQRSPEPAPEPQPSVHWRELAQRALHIVRAIIHKHPVGCVFALALVVLAIAVRLIAPAGTATLHLKMQHSFRSAKVSVWVDDKLAYSGQTSGATKRRFGVIPSSTVGGSFSRMVEVPAGVRVLRVQVSAPSEGYDHTSKIAGDFLRNGEVSLQIVPSRRTNDLSLAWQGTAPPLPDPGAEWYVKYAGSLLMTVAGSIISAVTAFLIRELPNMARRTDVMDKSST